MKILIKEYPLISHYSEPYNITSHKFSCYECGHVFVKHYIEDVTFKSNENKSFICDNCKNKAIKNIIKINTRTQEILYNDTIIAFYEKLKKKKIVISWMNDVNLDELNPYDIINAMDKIYRTKKL